MGKGGTSMRKSKADRDPLERWYTPAELVAFHVRVVRRLFGPMARHFGDPFAGDGRYMAEVERQCPRATTWSDDLGDDLSGVGFNENPERYEDSIIVTNPAFSRAAEALVFAMQHRAAGISFLLPISFSDTGVARRVDLLVGHPPQHEVRAGRWRFEGPALEHHRKTKGRDPGAMMAYTIETWARPGVALDTFGQTVTHWTDPADLTVPEVPRSWP